MLSTELTRDTQEAHLRLTGWVPSSYGIVGARRDDVLIYLYRAWNASAQANTLFSECHLIQGGSPIYKQDVARWRVSNELMSALFDSVTAYMRRLSDRSN
jgi:hypothetical protein